jgi:O-antigen/teichoic acid export membrane protein
MRLPQKRQPASEDGDTIARNTLSALAVQLTTATFTAGLTLYMVRALGPTGYGVFALAVGMGSLLILPSDFGISQSTARFVAEHRGDRRAITSLVNEAFKLKFGIAFVVCAGLFVTAGPIASAYDNPQLVWPLRGIAIALFGQSLMLLFAGTFIALRRVSVNLRVVFSESAMEVTASLGLILLGGGAAGAAFGRATGYIFGALVAVFLAARILGRPILSIRGESSGQIRALAGYAGALVIVDGAFTLFKQVDVVLIGLILGSTAVGLFEAPMRFVTFLHYPGFAVANGVAPRVASGQAGSSEVGTFGATLRYLVIFQAALIAPIVVWAEPIVDLLLGKGYEESADVLRALAPFVFLQGIAPLVSLAVNYLGEARRRIPIAIATVLINLGIDLVLIPRIGIVGGAIGTDVAYALYVPAHLWICNRLLGLELRPVGLAFARSMIAAGGMAAVLVAVGTESLSPVDWILGLVAGTAAFAVILLLTREVTWAELLALREAIGQRFRRPDTRG